MIAPAAFWLAVAMSATGWTACALVVGDPRHWDFAIAGLALAAWWNLLMEVAD